MAKSRWRSLSGVGVLAGAIGALGVAVAPVNAVGARLVDETQTRCSGLSLDVTPSVVGTPVVVRVEINGVVTLLTGDDGLARHFPFDAAINSWSYTVREEGMIRPIGQSGTTASCALADANADIGSSAAAAIRISAVSPVTPTSPATPATPVTPDSPTG